MTDPSTPAYLDIAEDLRRRIRAGQLAVGDPIPSTAQLVAQYDTSISTARSAVTLLRQEGVLLGRPGKGVYVSRSPDDPESTLPDRVSRLERLVAELCKRLDVSPEELELLNNPGVVTALEKAADESTTVHRRPPPRRRTD